MRAEMKEYSEKAKAKTVVVGGISAKVSLATNTASYYTNLNSIHQHLLPPPSFLGLRAPGRE